MKPNLVSQADLIANGWTKRQIEAALDEPDEVGPSGHWLNRSGKPYYERDRVAVAAYRIGLTRQQPTESQWHKCADGLLPCSVPVMTADFHRLAAACQPGVMHEFWSLRLSHPFAGRSPGARQREESLIQDCLARLVEKAFDVDIERTGGLERFLSERAGTAAGILGDVWPGGIIVRPASRASYLSTASSRAAIERFLLALSLVHVGAVLDPGGNRVDVRSFLVDAPRMRFDQRSGVLQRPRGA